MEAINFMTDWIKWLFIIIPVGAGTAVTYFSIRKSLSTDHEELGHYNKNIKQTIKGAIVAITISGFVEIVKAFYN